MAQQVARILGKDEVGGSNPLGSLKKERLFRTVSSEKSFFFYSYNTKKPRAALLHFMAAKYLPVISSINWKYNAYN